MEAKRQRRQTLVIGVGNEWRGDDAAGLLVARQLRRCGQTSFAVLKHDGEGAALMELWNGWDAVVVVDAVRSGAEPGTAYRFDAISQPLPGKIRHGSTHAFSLGEAIKLGRALNQLPRHLVVYAIEGQNFEAGDRLSSQVEGVYQRLRIVFSRRSTEQQLQIIVTGFQGCDLLWIQSTAWESSSKQPATRQTGPDWSTPASQMYCEEA
jgi:hydrogenase maturation protease